MALCEHENVTAPAKATLRRHAPTPAAPARSRDRSDALLKVQRTIGNGGMIQLLGQRQHAAQGSVAMQKRASPDPPVTVQRKPPSLSGLAKAVGLGKKKPAPGQLGAAALNILPAALRPAAARGGIPDVSSLSGSVSSAGRSLAAGAGGTPFGRANEAGSTSEGDEAGSGAEWGIPLPALRGFGLGPKAASSASSSISSSSSETGSESEQEGTTSTESAAYDPYAAGAAFMAPAATHDPYAAGAAFMAPAATHDPYAAGAAFMAPAANLGRGSAASSSSSSSSESGSESEQEGDTSTESADYDPYAAGAALMAPAANVVRGTLAASTARGYDPYAAGAALMAQTPDPYAGGLASASASGSESTSESSSEDPTPLAGLRAWEPFARQQAGSDSSSEDSSESSSSEQSAQEASFESSESESSQESSEGLESGEGSSSESDDARYSLLKARAEQYRAEFRMGSPELPSYILSAKQAVKAKKTPSVQAYMMLHFGWTQADCDKYLDSKGNLRWRKGGREVVRNEKWGGPTDFLFGSKRGPRVKEVSSEKKRAGYELHGGSTITQGDSKEPFDTSSMFSKFMGRGFGIYVMDPNGRIYASMHKVGIFHHSSFLAGADVAAAGELKVDAGVLKTITNKSGHYQPSTIETWQLFEELTSRGVNLSQVEYIEISPTGDQQPPRPVNQA